MNKQERKQLIKQISQASGVAQYALDKKMTDEQISQAAQNLEVLALVKPANNYNRYCQGQRTKEANDKLKSFLNPQNSEIVTAGKWLLNAFSMKGTERHTALLEKDLVHREDYNATVSDMRETISVMDKMASDSTQDSKQVIKALERTNDSLRRQLSSIERYIRDKYGVAEWKDITARFISKAR